MYSATYDIVLNLFICYHNSYTTTLESLQLISLFVFFNERYHYVNL